MRCCTVILLAWSMLMNGAAQAQDHRTIDSLKSVLMDLHVHDRFPVLYELTFEYLPNDRDSALYFIRDAERSALLSGDSIHIIKSRRVKSQILYLLNEPYQAIGAIQPLLTWNLSRLNRLEHHAIVDHLGLCHGLIGQFDRSLQLNFAALDIAETLNDPELLSISQRHIGFTYYKLKDYRKAVQYLLRASVHDGSSTGNSSYYINLSLAYSHLHQYDSAEFYLRRQQEFCKGRCGDEEWMHRAYASGVMYYGLGSLKKAEHEFLYSLDLARALKDSRIQLDNIYLLSKISLQNGRSDLAAKFLREGEELIRSDVPFNIEMIKVFSELGDLNLAIRNYPKAAEYQAKYIALKDSIYNESVTNRLIEIESHFLERHNEARIAEQEQIIFLNSEIIRRQERLNFLSGIIVILTAVFIFYLVRSFRRKQALNVLLDQKVKERTGELENTRQELLKYIQEKEAAFSRSWSGVHATVKTLRGLCHTASTEVSDPVARQYLEKIETTSWEVDRKFIAFSE